MAEANPRCSLGIMLIIAVEFAGLNIPFVIAPTMISTAGSSQCESTRSNPPLASDTIISVAKSRQLIRESTSELCAEILRFIAPNGARGKQKL
jgi:hypothetical protein